MQPYAPWRMHRLIIGPRSTTLLNPSPKESAMFVMISKKSRRTDRGRTARYRAKLKAKFKARRARLYQADKR